MRTFDIGKLTDVTVGGSPDVGAEPTAGLLKTLIDTVVDLSDEIATKQDQIEELSANFKNYSFELGDKLVDDVNMMIDLINTDINALKQVYYGDYHMTELPAGLSAPYYK